MSMQLNHQDHQRGKGPAGGESFEKHNERMRIFSRYHERCAGQRGLSFLESTRPLPLRPIAVGAGGARMVIAEDDWSLLVPLFEIAKHRLVGN